MVHDIDFLPDSYRQQQERRQRRHWRQGVFAIALVLIGIGTLGRYQTRTRLEVTRDRLRKHANQMSTQLQSTASLQREIERQRALANLRAYLSVRVPPTRLLAEVTNCLPEFVSLTDYRLFAETQTSSAIHSPRARRAKSIEQSEAGILPETQDLKQLQESAKESALLVTLEGIAPDDVSLSKYLAALEQSGIFQEVQLLFTNQHVDQDHELRSFGIRLQVRRPATNRDATNRITDHRLSLPIKNRPGNT